MRRHFPALRSASPIVLLRAATLAALLVGGGCGDREVEHTAAPARTALALSADVVLPVVRGREESCLACHAGIEGLDASHRPTDIGCASCHGGQPQARDADRAHAGMTLVPGNVADASRSCGQATCHAAVIPRIERSIMTTMTGVIAVNRRVFGASASGELPRASSLGTDAADTHLRQLCLSCHLGQSKTEWGPIDELSRGGGCNACHLVYDSAAARQLTAYLTTRPTSRTGVPRRHPAFTIAVDNARCFGCHSRSGRISTNYEGWHELRNAPSDEALALDARATSHRFRRLADGRYFERVTPDVHQTRNLDCIDCHTPGEVMGTGKLVARAREQQTIRCEDCHTDRRRTIAAANSDAETSTLNALRHWRYDPAERLGVAASGEVLANVVVDASGTARMRRKRTGTWAALRPPAAACTRGSGHKRLTCISCHTAWAPRCATCHTSFQPGAEAFDHVAQADVRGAWVESSGPFEAALPTLGVRWDPRDEEHPHGVVDTFVPGMIMELDRNQRTDGAPDRVFRRLYARTFSHTISRASRSCVSCHSDPLALGFGRGALRYEVAGSTGRWRFTPTEAVATHDGLPADAWTGFLRTRRDTVSTRDDVRPFVAEEQKRILEVGACLTCHDGASRVMQGALHDFSDALARRSARCVRTVW